MRTFFLGTMLVGCAAIALAGSSAVASSEQVGRIDCTTAHRPSVTNSIRLGPVVRLSAARRARTVRLGQFALRATTGSEPAQVPSGLSIRVWGRRSGKPVASAVYQFRPEGPSNQFSGGHGFTGLVYAYLSSGAELQYYCTVGR